MVEANVRSILIGENPEFSIRSLKAPTATLLIGSLFAIVGHLISNHNALLFVVGLVGAVFVLVFSIFSIAQAYQNQGLVVNWILLFAPLFVTIFSGFAVGLFYYPSLVEWVKLGVTQGGGYALLIGTATFIIGFVGRLLVDWRSEQI